MTGKSIRLASDTHKGGRKREKEGRKEEGKNAILTHAEEGREQFTDVRRRRRRRKKAEEI